MTVVLAPWTWVDDPDLGAFWRKPEGAVGGIDLRSLPQCGKPGPDPEGFGFFLLQDGVAVTRDMLTLGDTFGGALDADRQTIDEVLGLPLGSVGSLTTDTLLAEILLMHGQAEGIDRWKPLRGSYRRGVRIRLGGQVVWQEQFSRSHPAFANTVAVFQADYRRHKAAGVPLETLQKFTGAERLKLRLTADEVTKRPLLPSEYKDDGFREPETTITESFPTDTANLDTSNDQDLDWTVTESTLEVTGGQAENTTADDELSARAESDLSSDDHYSQAQCATPVGSIANAGVAARFSASEVTAYYGEHRNNTSVTYRTFKIVTGTHSELERADGTAPGSGLILNKLEVDGSDLEFTSGGTVRITGTDMSITGNLRAGLASTNPSNANRAQWDDFEAADLGAAPAAFVGTRLTEGLLARPRLVR